MSIVLTTEKTIPVTDVPKLPWTRRGSGGKRIDIAAVHRWCNPGPANKQTDRNELKGNEL